VEANVDFSDDELPRENVGRRLDLLARADDEMRDMLAGFPAARRWREGHRVVVCRPSQCREIETGETRCWDTDA
jgi:tRNA U34 5-carboxymethylaminomethyl modifying GTPase MnmE/TrmE